jgi:hypothetical protein
MRVIKTCSCRQCRRSGKAKRAAFREANRRFRHEGKRKPGSVNPVSTGFIG